MKTKLLKKVRKRFEIQLIEKVTPKSDGFLRDSFYDYKGPFFILFDSDNIYYAATSKTFEGIHNILVKLIIKEYIGTTKKRNEIRKKIWWNV